MAIDPVCKPLHIPYKKEKLDHQNVDLIEWIRRLDANWRAVERWSEDIVKHCLCDCASSGTSTFTITGCGPGVMWDVGFGPSVNYNITSMTITTDTPVGFDRTIDLIVDGSTVHTITLPSGDSTATDTLAIAVTTGLTVERNTSDFGVDSSVTIDQPNFSDTQPAAGCG